MVPTLPARGYVPVLLLYGDFENLSVEQRFIEPTQRSKRSRACASEHVDYQCGEQSPSRVQIAISLRLPRFLRQTDSIGPRHAIERPAALVRMSPVRLPHSGGRDRPVRSVSARSNMPSIVVTYSTCKSGPPKAQLVGRRQERGTGQAPRRRARRRRSSARGRPTPNPPWPRCCPCIQAHAVDATVLAEIVENDGLAERPVAAHGVRAQLPLLVGLAAALGHVQRPVVE